ncbi:hypothetical protein QZM42_32410, partial [Burkholderia vietnamiensis]
FSRKYIRLILANMPTVITSVSPAQRLSRAFNHVGQNSMKTTALGGSVLRGHQHLGKQLQAEKRPKLGLEPNTPCCCSATAGDTAGTSRML